MFSSRSQFDKLFDRATNTISSETDWTAVVKICEMIRQGEIQPKYVLAQIKKKSTHTDPHTALFALEVLQLCVKNCGYVVHDEISTQSYMEQLTDVVKTTQHDKVKNKILELLQAWAFVFKDTQKYRIILDTVNAMKSEGYEFPKMKESDAIFSTEIAPEWTTGLNCTQCGTQFGVILRKHHCRACGKVFCGQCSSKTCPLPRFGFEKEVRVCDHCYLKQKYSRTPTYEEMSIEYACSPSDLLNEMPFINTLNDKLTEEEALQLAIALSQSEVEIKKEDSTPSKCDKVEEVSQTEPGQFPSLSRSEDESSQYTHQCQSCGQEFYNKFLANTCSRLSKYRTGKVVKLCDKCKEKHCTPLFSKPKPSVVKLEEVPIELTDPKDEQIQVYTPSNIEETRDEEELQLEAHKSPDLSLSKPESSHSSLPQFEPESNQDIDNANNDKTFEEDVEVAEEAKYYYESETQASSLCSNEAQQQAFTEVNNINKIEGDTSSECSVRERFQMLKDDHDCTNCNEFTLFGQQIAIQLNKLSIVKALEIQQEIQRILTQARIDELSSPISILSLDNNPSSFQRSTSALSHDEVDSESSKESLKEQTFVTETESSA